MHVQWVKNESMRWLSSSFLQGLGCWCSRLWWINMYLYKKNWISTDAPMSSLLFLTIHCRSFSLGSSLCCVPCLRSTLLHHANFLDDKSRCLATWRGPSILLVIYVCRVLRVLNCIVVSYGIFDGREERNKVWSERKQPPYPQKHMLFWPEENSTYFVLWCKVNVLELLLKFTLESRHVCSRGSWDAKETCSFTICISLLIPGVYASFNKRTNF
jgi:hypothetical protein